MAARGRPRASGPSTSGLGTEQDILLAAGRLFCTDGYGSTSTYRIAEAAGISQASMYHYFAGKHEILLALLLETVRPSVAYASELVASPEPAAQRLRRLCAYDARLLASNRDNLGGLYLLPELGDERFAAFHAERQRLLGIYRELVAACRGCAVEEAGPHADLIFGLVESVILRRRRSASAPLGDEVPEQIAEAALTLVRS